MWAPSFITVRQCLSLSQNVAVFARLTDLLASDCLRDLPVSAYNADATGMHSHVCLLYEWWGLEISSLCLLKNCPNPWNHLHSPSKFILYVLRVLYQLCMVVHICNPRTGKGGGRS